MALHLLWFFIFQYACSITISKTTCFDHMFVHPRCVFINYIWLNQLSNTSQMKHQLDATLCRFYFCRVTLHVSGASVHHQDYLKLVQRPLVHVLSLQVSHHISLLGPKGPNKEM